MNGVIRKDANNHIIPGLYGFKAEKTVDYDGEAVSAQAVLSTALTGANNDIDFTAVPYGAKGNNISIAYVDPGGASATLGVVVTGNIDDGVLITVNLGRAASAINTTADLLKAALDTADVSAYVTYADKAANDGSGLVTAMAETPLAGGAGRTLFEVTGSVMVQYFVQANEDLTGSGTLAVGNVDDVDYLIDPEAVTGIDTDEFLQTNGTPSKILTVTTGTFLMCSNDIRDKIATDTITGSVTHHVFWYPMSDDGNLVATNE